MVSMPDDEDRTQADVPTVVFSFSETPASNPKLRARLLKLLGRAVVPALACDDQAEPALVGWHGGDRGRPVDELVLSQGDLTVCVRARSQSDATAEARATLALQLQGGGSGPVEPYDVECTIDGESVASLGATNGDEWVTVCTSEQLVVFVEGPGQPLTPLARSERDHQQLVGP
jgi:hypothetical protein